MNTPMEQTTGTLSIDTTFHGQKEGQALPSTQAYLFDSAGRLLAIKPVGAEAVTFEINPAQRYQIIVGSALVSENQEPPTDLMAQLTQA